MKTYGGFLISQTHQLGGRVFEKVLKQHGIDEFNGPQGKILYVLWEKGNLSISEIAQMTSLANTTLTGMLDRMETQGLIVRLPDPTNRRKTIISLTSKAHNLQTDYIKVSERTNEIYYSGFSEDEIKLFENTLKRIINNLEEYSKDE